MQSPKLPCPEGALQVPGCFTARVSPAVSLWCSSQGHGQCQLLPVLLLLLPPQHCPGLLSSLLSPPGLAIQLLSQLCKKLRTSSRCQLREQLCSSLFQWKSFGTGQCSLEQPVQVSQLHPMQSPSVLLRCWVKTLGTSLSSSRDQLEGWR